MTTDDEMKAAILTVAQAKVAEALGGDVLATMIDAVMRHRDTSYGSKANGTEFERIVRGHILNAIDGAVRDYLSGHREQISAAVKAAMESDGYDKLATSIVDAFASDDWRAKLEIKIDRD